MALREGLVRLLALGIRADQEVAQPHDAIEVGARLREPVRSEHARDARLVLREQGAECLLAHDDGADRRRPVAVQVAEVVEVATELIQRAAGLDQVVPPDHLAEHGPDPVERGLHAAVERLIFDVELVHEPASRVRGAHELRAKRAVRVDLALEPPEQVVADRRDAGHPGSSPGLRQARRPPRPRPCRAAPQSIRRGRARHAGTGRAPWAGILPCDRRAAAKPRAPRPSRESASCRARRSGWRRPSGSRRH